MKLEAKLGNQNQPFEETTQLMYVKPTLGSKLREAILCFHVIMLENILRQMTNLGGAIEILEFPTLLPPKKGGRRGLAFLAKKTTQIEIMT